MKRRPKDLPIEEVQHDDVGGLKSSRMRRDGDGRRNSLVELSELQMKVRSDSLRMRGASVGFEGVNGTANLLSEYRKLSGPQKCGGGVAR